MFGVCQIISYLDLQVQDLEGQLLEANHRCNHLQASLELQVNSLSLKVCLQDSCLMRLLIFVFYRKNNYPLS